MFKITSKYKYYENRDFNYKYTSTHWRDYLGCILLFGKSYLQKKGENTADKEDSQKIAMLKKIGENIATKQDIQDITNKVESIKASYNESLERHKMELQKNLKLTNI